MKRNREGQLIRQRGTGQERKSGVNKSDAHLSVFVFSGTLLHKLRQYQMCIEHVSLSL